MLILDTEYATMSYPMDQPSETDLWRSFKKGDKGAFDAIYKLHAPVLLGYALKLTVDRQLCEDCLQDLFIDLWRTRQKLSVPSSVKYYLLWSYRRRIFSEISHRQKHLLIDDPSKVLSTTQIRFNLEIELDQQSKTEMLAQELKDSIANLSSFQREIIYLRYYNGLSVTEISSVMDVSKKSVYNAMAKSMVALRRFLSGKFYH